ncbi:uncharacterized protein LOC117590557 [Drosophila guanche]|uniref:uncharacterized protein LOC117590557 n=1 Tax=Drosophila guanche TaxID=7266 RepID=UPI0014714974|nr:uncharacterized protein LOC117590557 [Drosophila guanche]
MSNQKQNKAPSQTPAQLQEPDKRVSDEQARRHRAKLRFTYGNMISNANLNRMRNKLNSEAGEAPAAFVSNVKAGSCSGLPHEDNEADEVMPHAPAPAPVALPEQEKEEEENLPSLDDWESRYSRAPGSSRAIERWQQLSSKVTSLFCARRYTDSWETPVAKTRRLREQREVLQIFTRPFLEEEENLPSLDDWESRYSRAPGSSRAIERWQQLSSKVTSLFCARRYTDSWETPVAKTRRLREQREVLQIFTRPFLVNQRKRE